MIDRYFGSGGYDVSRLRIYEEQRVRNTADGNERTFHEGEPLVEVVGTIHRGENRGTKPVILNMFYFAEPGQVLTIQHPEIE